MSNMNDLVDMARRLRAPLPKYQVYAATDLRTGAHSYKIYRRGEAQKKPPVVVGIATLAEAHAKVEALEAADEIKEKKT